MAKAGGTRAAKPSIPQLGWSEVRPEPVVLVSGGEDFLAQRAIGLLRDLLRAEDPSLEVTDVSADDYAAGELFTVASPSLFAEPRLIRVASVDRANDAFLADALDYLREPAEDATLVLRHASGTRGKALLDAVRSGAGGGIEIVCAPLKKDAERFDFAAAEFRALGARVHPAALRAVVGAHTENLAELSATIHQLVADLGGQITEEQVQRYLGGRAETTAFAVVDAAIAGRTAQALLLVRQAVATGSEPVPMVAAFAVKLRAMARIAGVRGSVAELASRFGLAPWQIERARRDSAGWTAPGLAACIEEAARTEADVKGAARDPLFALERLVRVVAGRGATAGTIA